MTIYILVQEALICADLLKSQANMVKWVLQPYIDTMFECGDVMLLELSSYNITAVELLLNEI